MPRRIALLALALCPLLASCSWLDARPSAGDRYAAGLVEQLYPAWTIDAPLVGEIAAADGIVLSYVDLGEHRLGIAAWDARSGEEVWRHDAATGAESSGASLDATIVTFEGEHYVPFLVDPLANEDDWQRLVVRNLRTGEDLPLADPEVWATERPHACADESSICLSGWRVTDADGKTSARELRLDANTRHIVIGADVELPDEARLVGDQVFTTNARGPGKELLGYTNDGHVQWQVPYNDVFGEEYSSDGGWEWESGAAEDVLIGTGWPTGPDTSSNGTYEIDAHEQKVVGLERSSGERLWSMDKAALCLAGEVDSDLLTTLIPLCVVNRGTLHISRSGPEWTDVDLSLPGLHTELVGTNILTGEPEWTVDLGANSAALVTGDDPYFASGGASRDDGAWRPVRADDTTMLLDALTGEQRDVPAGAILPCTVSRSPFTARMPGDKRNVLSHFHGGQRTFACDPLLNPRASTDLSRSALVASAVDAGNGHFVVGGDDTLTGYLYDE